MDDEASRLHTALADRYEIQRELGHGGMATVYLARDLRHSRVVAIKVLNREVAQAVGGERFLREISITAQLQHPHILTLIDSGEADGFLYYVMPYVEGESLRSKLDRDGALAVSEAMRLFREIVDALAHAHRHGMIHRDIKPDNVMISDRHALVVDFGVAKAMGDAAGAHNLTTIGMSLGTPAYMSPEQVTAESDVDQRADLYSAGIVAYEMLAGRPPFTGNSQQVMSAHVVTPPPPLSGAAVVPVAISRIVMKCLEKQRGSRYQEAEELLSALEALATPTAEFASGIGTRPAGTKRIAAMVGAGVIVAAGVAYAITSSHKGERWVRTEAIPEIQRYIESGANDSAFLLALKAEKESPGDSVLQSLWPRFTRKGVYRTEPAGAKVYRTMFNDTSRWELIGTTPTDTVRLPSGPSISRIRIEKPGYRRVDRLSATPPSATIVLDAESSPNPEMVRITGGNFPGTLPGLDAIEPITLADFLLDRHEVTNRQYKAFVDAGGYSKPEYWEHELVKEGRRLALAEAMSLFTDRTGRPGPATWEAGDFPPGQADLPVGGVSWYEAAAYAKFVGKSLPSIYHWTRAATLGLSAYIVPGSNFNGEGPAPKSTSGGMSGFGVFDMAGNVREWCYNLDKNNNRYILGGGWSDATYLFNDAFAQPPFDRAAINGVRLAKYPKDEPNLQVAMRTVVRAYRNYSAEKPVSDAEFRTFLTMYDYDPTPLQSKVETRDSSSTDMIVERVTFAAAYGNERVIAYLFLPGRGKPPYQTVVYFPGSNAIHAATSKDNLEINRIDFFLKSGRAVIYPIYKSTYERGDSLKSDYQNETIFYRDHVLMWAKDLRRSVDYLETRPEVDSKKIAYFGASWGGYLGGIMPAIEPRIKAAILYVAGLEMERARPEVDPFNFLPRVRIPVIMLNGKHDHFFPVETSQKPFFRLLGTPADQKRYVLYEGGHFVPRTQLIAESLSWLDKHLGPPR